MRPAKKRGPGRPSLGDAARAKIVTVKLTQDEYERVQDRARRDGADSVSAWIRERLGIGAKAGP